MDLSGRASGYRGVAIRCPGCAEPMTVVPLAETDVDVCPSCRGLWIDWFDGDIGQVTRRVLAHTEAPAPHPPLPRNEARATGACPRCHGVQLVVERYVPPAARAGVAGAHTGADLLRCEHCAGAFVSATSAALLGELPLDAGTPPPSSSKAVSPAPWTRLVALLRRWLGGG